MKLKRRKDISLEEEKQLNNETMNLLKRIREHLVVAGNLQEISLEVPIKQFVPKEGSHVLGWTCLDIPHSWTNAGVGVTKAGRFSVRYIAVTLYGGDEDDPEEGRRKKEEEEEGFMDGDGEIKELKEEEIEKSRRVEDRILPLRVITFVLLHELAHTLATPKMINKDHKGRAKRHQWRSHDHDEEFYKHFENILRVAEELDILRFSQSFGGGAISRKRAERLDSFETPGLMAFIKLGSTVARWVAEDKDTHPELHRIHGQESEIWTPNPEGSSLIQVFKITLIHPKLGSKLLVIKDSKVEYSNFIKMIENKFRIKRPQIFSNKDEIIITQEALNNYISECTISQSNLIAFWLK